jgi:hypothetical protein
MSPKLLFIIGIIAAHGVLAAGLVAEDPPTQRTAITTCIRAPKALPHYSPPLELLARADIPVVDLRMRQR